MSKKLTGPQIAKQLLKKNVDVVGKDFVASCEKIGKELKSSIRRTILDKNFSFAKVDKTLPAFKLDLPKTATLADVIDSINQERQDWRKQRDVYIRSAQKQKRGSNG